MNKKRIAELEQQLQAEEQREQQAAERAEFDYLQFKYMHLPEYEELERATEEMLDVIESFGEYHFEEAIRSPEALAAEDRCNELRERWLTRARELEREEQNGQT